MRIEVARYERGAAMGSGRQVGRNFCGPSMSARDFMKKAASWYLGWLSGEPVQVETAAKSVALQEVKDAAYSSRLFSVTGLQAG
ncbi:hypothetical protein E2P81_ATG10572 [Venturia nashicola]|nr:hypothetical protein E2P81_ATG10572 [Venturia nashicola]